MKLLQKDLYAKIGQRENMSASAVRHIFKTAEKVIYEYLSATEEGEDRIVRVMDGFSIESHFEPEKLIDYGLFEGCICDSRIKVKADVSQHYKEKLNHRKHGKKR